MLSNWQKSFVLMLESEGGFVNHPNDPGGMTNLGVTQSVWNKFIGRQSTEQEMRALTPEIVEPLYKSQYWDKCRCDDLPSGVDYLVFDFAVNAGPGRSAMILQTSVGTNPDGGIGPLTLDAVNKCHPSELINDYSREKENFYRSLTTFGTFGKGWMSRITKVKVNALLMVQ